MKAKLLLKDKFVYSDGAIREMTLWKLPKTDKERPHGLKYSLYYGRDGVCAVRYDNERGKGDHRHYGDQEEPYKFESVEKMIQDFNADIQEERGKKKMKKQHIHVGVEDSSRGLDRFVETWKNAEAGKTTKTEIHLNYEDFAMLAAVLTPKRLQLLKALRKDGPLSVRALSKNVDRDYKNVHVDCTELEAACLIERDSDNLLIAPWDVIDAHFSLVA
jgi:predicted transcriptional regulator